MPRSFVIIGNALRIALVLFALSSTARGEIIKADDYQNFWLWAGVEPQPVLSHAQEIYLLAGEVSDRGKPQVISQRSALPHIVGPGVWIVYRVQTLEWDEAVFSSILKHTQNWKTEGNRLIGLQIDFDAGTKHLDRYVNFLTRLRMKLPQEFKLSVTGLLDWSANGDPAGLDALAGVVDELVLQIYQGNHVIPGYARYLTRLDRLKIPFRIGLLQGGEWQDPPSLARNRNFAGYVVFLRNANN
jgi:Protein of unknown function (DUF3142)